MSEALKILLVEHDENDRENILQKLNDSEMQVEITQEKDAGAGFNALERERFDCVLLDYMLPNKGGLELLNKIQASENAKLPVVMLADREDKELYFELIQYGAIDYLVKGEVGCTQLEKAIHYAIEREKSSDALIESSNKFESFFNMTNDILFILDRNRVIQQTNPSTCSELGYRENDLMGKDIIELFSPTSKELLILQISMCKDIGTQLQELEILCSDGRVINVDCAVSAVCDAIGEITSFSVFLHDITDQKLAEDEIRCGKDLAEEANREIEDQLEIAKEIQQGLYPDDIPQMESLEIAASLFQARQVGGDYYDIIPLSDHEMAFVVVDVAGHDIAAAFIVGMAKISFSAHIPVYTSLVEVFKHVNEDMLRVIKKDRFLTAFLSVIDTQTRTLRYSKAGHFYQCIYKADTKEIQLLSTDGMFLGAFEDGYFEEKCCEMNVGDKLVLFTDGLFENRNSMDEQYSQKRLRDHIKSEGYNSAEALHDILLKKQGEFIRGVTPEDDTCLLVVELKECSHHLIISSLLDGEVPTLNPVLVDSKRAANETVQNILSIFEKNNYSDMLIYHYKKILVRIIDSFHANKSSEHYQLKIFTKIDTDKFKVGFIINTSTMEKKSIFFTTDICRNILVNFNRSFGTIDIYEPGDRLIFSYKKEIEVESAVEDITFEQKEDGAHIIVPKNLSSSRTLESVLKELISKDVVNADFNRIREELQKKSGKAVKVGSTFEYYDRNKEKLYNLKFNSLEAKIVLQDSSEEISPLTKQDIQFKLAAMHIVYGIDSDIIEEIVSAPQAGKEYIVARGKPAVNGEDAEIKECVKIDASMAPIIKEDSNVDHKTLDLMKTVKSKTVILEKKPATPGTPGRSIFGRTIDFHPGEDKPLLSGDNTEITENGTRLIAKTDGYLFRSSDGTILVKQIFHVKSNVDYSTGNIKYDGDVFINGNVLSGFGVECGQSISVNGEIEAAKVTSKSGKISCTRGILGKGKAVVSSGRDIEAEFIQEAVIECMGDLYVKSSILNVTGTIGGNLIMEDSDTGLIIGGELVCKGNINVAEIGNKQHVKTIISMGKKQNDAIRKKIIEMSKKKDEVKRGFLSIENKLQTKSRLFKIKAKRSTEENEDIELLLKKY